MLKNSVAGVEAVRAMAAQTDRARDAAAAGGLISAVQSHGLALSATSLFAAAVRALSDVTSAAAAAPRQQGARSSHVTGPLLRVIAACVPQTSLSAVVASLATLAPSLKDAVRDMPRSASNAAAAKGKKGKRGGTRPSHAYVQKSLLRCYLSLIVKLAGTPVEPEAQRNRAVQQLRALTNGLFSMRLHRPGVSYILSDAYFETFCALNRNSQQLIVAAYSGFVLDVVKARVDDETVASDMDYFGQLLSNFSDFEGVPKNPETDAQRAGAVKVLQEILKQYLSSVDFT